MLAGKAYTIATTGCLAGVAAASTYLFVRRHANNHPKQLRLTYLDMPGVAEPIRLALAIGSIPFEDKRIGYEEIASMRAAGELPFSQLPLLDIDGVRHAQSNALLRWAGARAGLYPDRLQLEIDSALEQMADIQKAMTPLWYRNALSRSPASGSLYEATALSGDQLDGVLRALNSDLLPVRFGQLERLVTRSGGPFLTGEHVTIADLTCHVMVDGILDGSYCDGVSASVLDECAQLRNLSATLARHPKVVEWNERGQA